MTVRLATAGDRTAIRDILRAARQFVVAHWPNAWPNNITLTQVNGLIGDCTIIVDENGGGVQAFQAWRRKECPTPEGSVPGAECAMFMADPALGAAAFRAAGKRLWQAAFVSPQTEGLTCWLMVPTSLPALSQQMADALVAQGRLSAWNPVPNRIVYYASREDWLQSANDGIV